MVFETTVYTIGLTVVVGTAATRFFLLLSYGFRVACLADGRPRLRFGEMTEDDGSGEVEVVDDCISIINMSSIGSSGKFQKSSELNIPDTIQSSSDDAA